MANDLKVTLDKSTTPWLVDVDQKNGANQVARSAAAQTITWQLNGNAASGAITGFEWITEPPAGIFQPDPPVPDGKSMSVSDTNNSIGTTGDWTYKLTITVDGNSYSSPTTSIGGAPTNPSIKNN